MLGLAGSTHCLVMCGGIGSTLGFHQQEHTWPVIGYNLGRIVSYMVVGLSFGSIGLVIHAHHSPLMLILRLVAALLLLLMGLYTAGWWKGLAKLEAMGDYLFWQRVKPIAVQLTQSPSPTAPLIIGMLWGWLPCGLVYSTLAWSSLSANPLTSALLMGFFGLGTMPAMLATGFFAKQLRAILSRRKVRSTMGTLLILFAIWTAVAAMH